MLILLPPSETKRPGGRGAPLAVDALSLPSLGAQRREVMAALIALSVDEEAAVRVLKLGTKLRDEVAVNAALAASPTMPAIDRYTGVLFDALDTGSLDAAARRWLGAHVLVHSAPFGPVGALDRIPSYRLGAGTSLPGLPSLRKVWADAVTRALAEDAPRFVLDLRSEAYVGLGPVPENVPSTYVRVVSEGGDGVVRALNHFNKHTKGELVRTLAQERPRVGSERALLSWAEAAGLRMRRGSVGEVELFA